MANSVWCVRPTETAPITLKWTDPDDGSAHEFWVRLKRRLNIGEQRRIESSGWTGFRPGSSEIGINWQEQAYVRVLTWVTSWSLEDDERRRLPVSRDVLETLHPSVYTLIEDAISAHIKEITEEKKVTSGDEPQPATSA